jgi:hypothetical protein
MWRGGPGLILLVFHPILEQMEHPWQECGLTFRLWTGLCPSRPRALCLAFAEAHIHSWGCRPSGWAGCG